MKWRSREGIRQVGLRGAHQQVSHPWIAWPCSVSFAGWLDSLTKRNHCTSDLAVLQADLYFDALRQLSEGSMTDEEILQDAEKRLSILKRLLTSHHLQKFPHIRAFTKNYREENPYALGAQNP